MADNAFRGLLDFYRDKRVLVTGHTGFKGAWLCGILLQAGARVTGFALPPPTAPSLFSLCGLEGRMRSLTGDVRDLAALRAAFAEARPQVVFHLAAQPIVRASYRDPVGTYATNVMGTVHLLDCVRGCAGVKSVVNVTTDKVYRNNEWEWGYRETDALGGFDPYSNSKACAELVSGCFRDAFFPGGEVALSTARAGNVIGGGDFAPDRIVPDCVRAAAAGRPIGVRSPYSTRPYQHVLEALGAYLLIAKAQYEDGNLAGSYNIGPGEDGCATTERLVTLFCRAWGEGLRWENRFAGGPHEAGFLKLDCARVKKALGWRPRWGIEEAVARSAAFYKAQLAGGDAWALARGEIEDYFGGAAGEG